MDLFNNFRKQKNIVNFKSEILADKLSQSYLFIGEDKETNFLYAQSIAILLQCPEFCLNCPDCLKIKNGLHPDVQIYPKEGKFSVESSAQILDEAYVKPVLCDKKVFILNNIDFSSEESQNKLLKIIEEPPKNVYFILTCINENAVLSTIKSRCQKRYVEKFSKHEIGDIFIEYKDNRNFALAIENCDGLIGKFKEIIVSDNYKTNYEFSLNLFMNLTKSEQIIHFTNTLSKNKDFFNEFLNNISIFYRDLLMMKLNLKENITRQSLESEYINKSNDYSVSALVEILKILSLYKERLDSNVSLNISADNLLLKILEVKFLCK